MHTEHELNKHGRDFVIGDLHGCLDLLNEMLAKVNFDKKIDRIFSVGDLIDRGPKSLECLMLITEPWFHSVRGNHEDMMVKVLLEGQDSYMWMVNGGLWSNEVDGCVLMSIAEVVNKLPYSITVQTNTGSVGICHAQPPSMDWNDTLIPDDRSKEIMIWARSWIEDKSMADVSGVTMTVHGHTPIDKPINIGNVHFIDTCAFHTGKLSFIEL